MKQRDYKLFTFNIKTITKTTPKSTVKKDRILDLGYFRKADSDDDLNKPVSPNYYYHNSCPLIISKKTNKIQLM